MRNLDVPTLVLVLTFCGGIVAALVRLLWLVSRLDFKLELMWLWWTSDVAGKPRRGRRNTDPPVMYSTAAERPTQSDRRG